MYDRDDVNLVLHDAIDEPIAAGNELPEILVRELLYDTADEWSFRQTLRRSGDPIDPLDCCARPRSPNTRGALIHVLEGARRPDDLHGSRR